MSGLPYPGNAIRSGGYRCDRSRLFASVLGVSVVILWSALVDRAKDKCDFVGKSRTWPSRPAAECGMVQGKWLLEKGFVR
jgi:hypothetical protein